MIGTGPESYQALMTDNYQTLKRPQNRRRKCPTEKLSSQCAVIWAGITSRHLKQITLNRTSPTIPGREKNPRKPTRVSVAMPPDDWLCQKLERLNLTALEGYPSRLQDSAGLKKDQFIKVPNSQSKWYSMHLMKPDEPHRPGRTVFNWRNTEAKVNSQFPRITKASAYPSTGPPSRPISQESLRRWERAAREDSYVINHATGFSRCST